MQHSPMMSASRGMGPEFLPHPSGLDGQEDCSTPTLVEGSQRRGSLVGSSAEGCSTRQELATTAEQQQRDCSKPGLAPTDPVQDADKLHSAAVTATNTGRAPGSADQLAEDVQKPGPTDTDTEHCLGSDAVAIPEPRPAPQTSESSSADSLSPATQATDLPPYQAAVPIVLPWRELIVWGFEQAPWLPLLPLQANGSLHEWGRLLFSQTPACKRGSVSVEQYGKWVLDTGSWPRKTSAADTLVKCCAAFAYSPLSLIIGKQAAIQCISLATRAALGVPDHAYIPPSLVEAQLQHVCAAGCGKDLSQGHTDIAMSLETARYCSQECADKHGRELPTYLRIYMCWPKGWVDCTLPHHRTLSELERRKLSVRMRALSKTVRPAPQPQLAKHDLAAYMQKHQTGFSVYNLARLCAYVRCYEPLLRRDHPVIKAYHDITKQYIAGTVHEEDTYSEIVLLLYNNEHIMPELRASLGDVLPPRPLPAWLHSASDGGAGRGAGRHKKRSTTKPLAVTTTDPLPASQHTPQPTPPLPAPSHPTPVSHTTPATTHAPDSPCTTVQRLTEADLARISDLARDALADALRDGRPMLWHVRRRAYEQACARMGLPTAGVQSLLWVASERGDAWGSLTALHDADPTGLCLPPELRTPYHVWTVLSGLTSHVAFYTLGEGAVGVLIESMVRDTASSGPREICLNCGKSCENPESPYECQGCGTASLCSEECTKEHEAGSSCGLLKACWEAGDTWKERSRAILPQSLLEQASTTPHTSDPTPHPSSPLQRDASATAGCPAAAAVPAPSRGVSAQRTHKRVSAAQALAAEYRQCVEGNPLLQRVAEVVMPRGAEREPESAAVMAAQQLLIAASGLLDARDLEEVLAAAGA